MIAMILSAGLGERLRPYTLLTPKPCIPFFSVPMACYSMALLESLKIEKIVVNTHHLENEMRSFYLRYGPSSIPIEFSTERDRLLGSGGGINKAKSLFHANESFVVLNGDTVLIPEVWSILRDIVQHHNFYQPIATLGVIEHEGVGSQFGGAWTQKEGPAWEVKMFSKQSKSGHKGFHFTGIMILHPRIFQYFKNPIVDSLSGKLAYLEENILYETLTLAISRGERVIAFPFHAQWYETGNKIDFLSSTQHVLQEIIKDPSSLRFEYLKQVVRIYGGHSLVIENDSAELDQKVRSEISKIRG